jgi:repressor of nif and glnA expression
MVKGIWVWPEIPRRQKEIIEEIKKSNYMVNVLSVLAKSKEGLSDSQIDEEIRSNSLWLTLWTLRQLLALGFIKYEVPPFGEPGKYTITELGKNVLQRILPPPQQQKVNPVAT